MPFTPFHLGPALLIAMIFFPYLDIIALGLGSIIVDIEPAYYLFFTNKGPYHGFLHSFLGATITGIGLSLALYPFRKTYLRLVRLFGLNQDTDFKKILGSSLIGTYSHIILDMPLYPEMKPLYPLPTNLFLNTVPLATIIDICLMSFLLGFLIYLVRILRKR